MQINLPLEEEKDYNGEGYIYSDHEYYPDYFYQPYPLDYEPKERED